MKLKYMTTNKNYWNELVGINFNSSYYNVKPFPPFKNSLPSLITDELGNVKGKKILHLQCHFGMDTLSLSNLGADVTGIDFSGTAIKKAKLLNDKFNLNAKFICSDVFNLPEILDEKFDIVFASFGVLVWINNLNSWIKVVSNHLKSDGFLYLADEHPFARVFCNPQKGEVAFNSGKFNNYWNNNGPCNSAYTASYADPSKPIKNTSQYVWSHSMSEILNNIVNNGLSLNFLHEFDKTFYKMFTDMEKKDDWWILKGLENKIPLMFSLKATKNSNENK